MKWLKPLALIACVLAAWELAARSGLWSPLLFPSLVKIGSALAAFAGGPEGWQEAWVSLYRALGGFALAAVVGEIGRASCRERV